MTTATQVAAENRMRVRAITRPNTRILPTAGRAIMIMGDRDPADSRRTLAKPGAAPVTVPDVAANQERAVRRARQESRDYAVANRMHLMVTLTCPAPHVYDYNTWYDLLRGYMRHQRDRLPGRYLALAELHAKQDYHWHILLTRRLTALELLALRESWTAYLLAAGYTLPPGARYARVNLEDFTWAKNKRGKRYKVMGNRAVGKAAWYATKYVGKLRQTAVGRGRHRYLRSLGGEPATLRLRVLHTDDFLALLRDEFACDLGVARITDSRTLEGWDKPFHFLSVLWIPDDNANHE